MVRWRRHGALLLACVAAGCGDDVTSAAGGGWRAADSSPIERTEVAAARVGQHAYLVGGYVQKDRATTGITQRFDLREGTWRTVAPLPQPVNHAAAGAYRGDVYVVGGDTGSGPTNAFWRYDPRANRWSRMPDAPTARSALGAAVIGDRLYAIGGVGGPPLRTLEIFDFRTRRWTTGPPMRFAREHLGATAARGRLYVVGGRVAASGGFPANLTVAERYDPRSRRWTRLPELQKARGGNAAAATTDGHVVAVGGEEESGTIEEVEVLAPGAKRWRRLANMRTPRHGLGAIGFGDRIFTLQGGPRPGFHFSGAAESLRVP
jgi:N-acetylneuraminic acid mutarotase